MEWSVLSIEINSSYLQVFPLLTHLDPGEGGLSPRPGEDGGDGVLHLLDDRTQNIRLASGLIIETELRQSRLTGAWL